MWSYFKPVEERHCYRFWVQALVDGTTWFLQPVWMSLIIWSPYDVSQTHIFLFLLVYPCIKPFLIPEL
jgi:hypothetical protein